MTAPVTKEVELSVLENMYALIIDLQNNTQELLTLHINNGGIATRSGRAIKAMYELDIGRCERLRKYAVDNNWSPF